eukprot:6774532-Pyramimonas_sp.AAC.1
MCAATHAANKYHVDSHLEIKFRLDSEADWCIMHSKLFRPRVKELPNACGHNRCLSTMMTE